MSEKKDLQEQINAEDLKEALAQKQQKAEKRSNILYTGIVVAFLIVAAIAVIWRTNLIPKTVTAVTIDGEKYTAAEVDFYYQNSYNIFVNNNSYMLSYIGLNTMDPLDTQVINETAAAAIGLEYDGVMTWHDFFLDQAIGQMTTVKAALDEAEATGFVYPASVQQQYDSAVEALESTAKASGVSADQYIQDSFSRYMSAKPYYEQALRVMQYEAYSNNYINSQVYTDDELTAAYEANKNTYDLVHYEYISISGLAEPTTDADGNPVDPTEEESAAAMAEAEKLAKQVLADFRAGASLADLAAVDEEVYHYFENDLGSYSGSTLTEWLFDESRKAGDNALIETETAFYVVLFHERYRDESPTVDVRHILIAPEASTILEGNAGYEEERATLMAAAKAEADEVYAQWQAGEATEESFAALAMVHTEDGGSQGTGGLYTGVYEGQMVPEFNDWCFDSSRKTGDTGMVETSYGYHIMYFVGDGLDVWQAEVEATLKNEAYNAWYETLGADYTAKQSDFGMKFVG